MFKPRVLSRLSALLVTVILYISAASAAAGNAVVTQGGRTAMPPTGSAAPAIGYVWDILLESITVANSAGGSGWSVSYSTTTKLITVQAPLKAKIALGYTVRFYVGAGNYVSAVFDVQPGVSAILLAPNSVVGGGIGTARILLTGAGTTKTLVALKSSSSKVTLPASVTIPAGVAASVVSISTLSTSSDLTATVSGSCGGTTVSAPLKVYSEPNLSFKAPLVYPVPSANDIVWAADMNGDGKPDVIIGTSEGWGILYGNGDGTLKPYVNIYSWSGGLQVRAVEDLNGDNRPDVVANDGNGNLLVFLNKGGGQFAAPQLYTTLDITTGVLVADFNGDGHPDLLVTSVQNGLPNRALVMLNKGNGTFSYGASWDPGFYVQGRAAATLRDQNHMDVVLSGTTNTTGLLGIWYGDGKGNFTAGPVTGASSLTTGGIAIADLLGNGLSDIIVGTWWDGTVSIHFGQSNGSFASPVAYSIGTYPSEIRTAYMKGDGQLDIIAGRAGTNYFDVLQNQGGLFGTVLQFDSGGGDVRSIAIADMNGDGKPDVITQGTSTNTISVILNNRP